MDILFGVIFALLVVLFAGAWAIYRLTFGRKAHVKDKRLDDIQKRFGPQIDDAKAWRDRQTFQTVHIRSRDGLELAGYYLPHSDARGVVLVAHGYRSRMWESYIAGRHAYEKGCSVLIICQRAHGESQGETITFGAMEHQDCLLWVDWLTQKEPGKGIILHGISMGATTVLLCADKVGSSVKGIVGDCGFTSPWNVLTRTLRHDVHLPVYPIMPICDLFCRLFGHFSMVQVNTINTLAFAKVPVLLVHGEADDFVPYAMGQENARACLQLAEFVSVPGAGHATSAFQDPERVWGALDAFMEKVL